ncbi:hypothetical protein TVAG_094160 [Trichomonas vaginalis G3]|uniref:Uncharacterized protein n=1 Tax=Trichomonas vaginalis (strain ATCC PRA-98 / G3) TaxID=412133 RepID=A2DBN8_TRIV3|nr:hypothetical protein TVAGG3_0381200 [Trichomonas vaginalis G3]EAY22241.1 hypothetical protein TVAG_094160 [Trichomonas vaginalis G3]KAI5533287.1 hypothetical protein TVAGG3_0381200 [Trichomonas vaginalis G3]|eukprot:XP_001583227.1 hypothetical protein [Trichomonas vaginalis G3]
MLNYTLSNDPIDASQYAEKSTISIQCNYSGEYFKLDASKYKDVYIDAYNFCIVNITSQKKKIRIYGPAQVYLTGDDNTLYDNFDLSLPSLHPLVFINGHRNKFKISWYRKSTASYSVVTAIVNDTNFTTSDPKKSTIKFENSLNSNFVGNIGTFYKVNISQIYPSSDYKIYYHYIPNDAKPDRTEIYLGLFLSIGGVLGMCLLAWICSCLFPDFNGCKLHSHEPPPEI